MTYGSDIMGVTPVDIRRLRSMQMMAAGGYSKGMNTEIYWALTTTPDPIRLATCTLGRWAREVRSTTLPADVRQHSYILTIAELSEYLTAAKAKLEQAAEKTWAGCAR